MNESVILSSFILATLLLYIITIFQKQKIDKLNNIINELEKYLIEQVEKSYSNDYDNVLDKLDELKGSDKE